MRKYICLVVLFMLALSSVALAEERLIEASGEYVMDSRLDETPATATARAREEAKRAAVEKAGVYVESYSETVNLMLTVDEVRTIASQILKIQEEKSNITVVQDNLLKFTVTIKALVDDNAATMKAVTADRSSLEESARQYRELQQAYSDLEKQMAELKRKYAGAEKDKQAQAAIVAETARNNERWNAAMELEKGNDCYARKEYIPAIEAYTRAISLDGSLGAAYNNRGNAYAQMGEWQAATGDLTAAARLMPEAAEIHNNLGGIYLSQKQYSSAISEYTRAIELKANFAAAYYNRAIAYGSDGRLREALADAQKATELDPGDSAARELYEKLRNRV